jgi:GNAT superfamily N-acetyltransferase
MQEDLFSASEKGHAAAKAAAAHADREIDDWTLKAVALFAEYARQSFGPFLTEQARQYAESRGLSAPPDGRAWGHIAKNCQRAGVIASAGFGSAKSSNGSPKVLWKGL